MGEKKTVRLHEDDGRKLDKIIVLLEDPNIGLCKTVRNHTEMLYGTGRAIGVKTKLVIIYIAIGILALALGADHPWVLKMISKLGGV